MLLNIGADTLRRFVEERIAEAFPDYDLSTEKETEPTTENLVIEDVFSVENESGQLAVDYLFDAARKYEAGEFLLDMPTVQAYEAEHDLVIRVGKHSKGELPDAALKIVTDRFIKAHLRSNGVLLPRTGDGVPLFHLTRRANVKRLENLTCNQMQLWIIREFWLRQNPEAEIDIINL